MFYVIENIENRAIQFKYKCYVYKYLILMTFLSKIIYAQNTLGNSIYFYRSMHLFVCII